ncbi:hypothetical protein G7Y89_g4877 [Cudoniella acicularis]|uniref:Pathogen-related protein n=1 Tax=Cudoniella acicularis TaxID=354080 RepID=A0A8H4W688_9HELO|nr:hypothetical protein G7Y89_g4877 [Cudoniella acicularis]
MAAATVENPPAEPAGLPDYLLDPNAVLKDDSANWRYGRAPDYSNTRKVYSQTKTMNHEAKSLPSLVENLVKNWEVEASFKSDINDWRTVDRPNYTFAINGGPPQSAEHMLKVGTYNAIIAANEYYSPENMDFASSHKTFKRMMPTFAWEVLEVYSGPPVVAFKWRHWGTMKNDYVGFNDKGEKVTAKSHGGQIDIQGITVAKVDDKVRLQSVETWFDPLEMFRQIAPNGIVNKTIVKAGECEAEDEGHQVDSNIGTNKGTVTASGSSTDEKKAAEKKSEFAPGTAVVAAADSEEVLMTKAIWYCAGPRPITVKSQAVVYSTLSEPDLWFPTTTSQTLLLAINTIRKDDPTLLIQSRCRRDRMASTSNFVSVNNPTGINRTFDDSEESQKSPKRARRYSLDSSATYTFHPVKFEEKSNKKPLMELNGKSLTPKATKGRKPRREKGEKRQLELARAEREVPRNDSSIEMKYNRFRQFSRGLNITINDLDAAFEIVKDINIRAYLGNLKSVIKSSSHRGEDRKYTGIIGTDDPASVLQRVETGSAEDPSPLKYFREAWDLVSLVDCVDSELGESGHHFRNYREMEMTWKREAGQIPLLSRINWTSSLEQGRKYKIWCREVSGDSVEDRGILLMLLAVLAHERDPSEWTLAGKHFNWMQIRAIARYIKKDEPIFVEVIEYLNPWALALFQRGMLEKSEWEKFCTSLVKFIN